MTTPVTTAPPTPDQSAGAAAPAPAYPSALDVAVYAVSLLELCPLFNSARGAVFTRDGTQELEASVMVSTTTPANPGATATSSTTAFPKRACGVMGIRRVKHPVRLAGEMLRRGETDLWGRTPHGQATEERGRQRLQLDVPSAQGHTLVYGETAEALAQMYGLELVDPSFFFTQQRWDEHVKGLEREKEQQERQQQQSHQFSPTADTETPLASASWSPTEYLPQGTCGAVALDASGLVCCATSTGGLTNKLSGRIGDTPTVGAGFWAEEWPEGPGSANTEGTPTMTPWQHLHAAVAGLLPGRLSLSPMLEALLADCLPTPFLYTPVAASPLRPRQHHFRAIALSGTGNGDSFLRTVACRTVGSLARWGPPGTSASAATRLVAGPDGELQRSAGDRWGRTGEGEGGMIGVGCRFVRLHAEDGGDGDAVEGESEIVQELNCAGMFRAWVDERGKAVMRAWREGEEDILESMGYTGEGRPEDVRDWVGEKDWLI